MTAISSSDKITVVKSPTDHRHYRFRQLSNGLCALLVHDRKIREGVQKAAAAMCMGLGSFADPKEAQGLSHLLEHMVFLGSTDFPKENEFDRYLAEHGGSSNAYTDVECACYFFDVKGEFLYEALRRFAPLFISPLMDCAAIQREISSIDSEFHDVLQDDSERLRQLHRHTATSGHPFNRFTRGNKKSLSDGISESDLRDHVLKLQNEYFHGDMMNLVVIGRESLDTLEGWVLELFRSIKKGHLVKAETSFNGPIWKAGKIYKLEAVADIHRLELSWTLPSLSKDYLKKASEYIAFLLGHEGKGSVFHLLRTKGWVSSLDAGVTDVGMYRSSIAYIFRMTIQLTDLGVKKIFEIIDFVYQYLKQLSPQKWLFKELRDIANLEFMLEEKRDSNYDYAKDLAGNLHVYPPQHVIYWEYAYKTWDVKMIKDILGSFQPGNMRVDLQTHCFGKDSLGSGSKRKRRKSRDIRTEPWFGLRYVVEDIPKDWTQTWENSSTVDPSFCLPAKNMFIARDVPLRAYDKVCEKRCILSEPILMLWYQYVKVHKLPLVSACFRITLNTGDRNLRNELMVELFPLLLNAELNDVMYQANEAKLDTSILYSGDKLVMKVDGLVDKLSLFLTEVLPVFKSFSPKYDCFKVIKELVRTLKNTNVKSLDQSEHALKRVLFQSLGSVEDKLKVLGDLSCADLEAFIPDLLSKLHIEGNCNGNLLENEALQIAQIFKNYFSVPLVPSVMGRELVACLPSRANLFRDEKVKNDQETNSAIKLYYQMGPNTVELYALAVIFKALVQEHFYNEIRTKMQLGYEPSCGIFLKYGVLGFHFSIQSCEFDPLYLQKKIVDFINNLGGDIGKFEFLFLQYWEIIFEKKQFNNEEFQNYKSGSLGDLLERENLTFSSETSQVGIRSLLKQEYSRKKKVDIISWYETYFRKSSPHCRKLTIRVWGCNTDMTKLNAKASSTQVIEDIDDFKRRSVFYTEENDS